MNNSVDDTEDKFQLYIDTLIEYEEDADEENITKLIKKIKKEGGQFSLESDEGYVEEWANYCAGSRYFCERFFRASCSKNQQKITRPPMPSAAPIRPRHLVSTQQGVET